MIKDLFKAPEMIDLTDAEHVQVYIDQKRKVWVNVDGICLLRIGKTKSYTIDTHHFNKTMEGEK